MNFSESYYSFAPSDGFGVIYFIIAVIMLVSMWKIFIKAGYAGWKCIVPLYNIYCLYKMTWGNGWMFLLLLIPIVNVVISIMTYYKLAKAFEKGIGFCLGLLFLSVIFFPILAFGDAKYQGVPN
jgi:uncharacterized membrane protein